MKYLLQFDTGNVEFNALHDAEAQTTAREFLTKAGLLPQRRKNYLYRHTLHERSWNVKKTFWRWEEIPFCSDGRVRIGWC